MKKILFFMLSFSLISMTAVAQEELDKAVKKAAKELGTYNLDVQNNGEKLIQAKADIDQASQVAGANENYKYLYTRGQIYNELCNVDQIGATVNRGYQPKYPDAALVAYESLKGAYDKALKKFEKTDAIKRLEETSLHLSNAGLRFYDGQNFDLAYMAFQHVLDIHELFGKEGIKSRLDNPNDLNNQKYITALCAMNANKLNIAGPLFEELKNKNFEEPAVYDGLYKVYSESDPAKALSYLEAGRVKFPDNVGLLFTEINHYLRSNKLEQLEDKLKLAIQKEPDNIGLYVTLGTVYDNLFQQFDEKGDKTKGQQYFDNALSYYNQALEKDPKNFDATYSIGALYYNKAAAVNKGMKALEEDFSKAATLKYEELKKEMFDWFGRALPYFQKAESVNANDRNTLIALKEIYAKENDLAKSNEFKRRLDVVETGQKNESSYFKQ